LRDRLKRIQNVRHNDRKKAPPDYSSAADLPGWDSAGYLTLRREIIESEMIAVPPKMPEAAGIVMPGIDSETAYEDLLFFDLETSGLSGGAGTVAFLAAFGRLVPQKNVNEKAPCELHITQYLLLDYPGESDFTGAMAAEINKGGNTVVSYNGKSFDSQILKTRCIMNGIALPEYRHADLLHPARRLWKRLLPDCSQGTIEERVLGVDRTGDIPGAMAPDIWFSFLKDGETGPLLDICEHNRRDIAGLASLFSTMAAIADDPLKAAEKINYDLETFALYWHDVMRKYAAGNGVKSLRLREKGQRLLRHAAGMGGARAMLRLAHALLKEGKHDEGREWLVKTAGLKRGEDVKIQRIMALRALAIDSEHRLGNAAEALSHAEQALELLTPDSTLRKDFDRRILRLRKKLWTPEIGTRTGEGVF
jgi:uncharacterized protein YprB with RNaseH-like and TPR domain